MTSARSCSIPTNSSTSTNHALLQKLVSQREECGTAVPAVGPAGILPASFPNGRDARWPHRQDACATTAAITKPLNILNRHALPQLRPPHIPPPIPPPRWLPLPRRGPC